MRFFIVTLLVAAISLQAQDAPATKSAAKSKSTAKTRTKSTTSTTSKASAPTAKSTSTAKSTTKPVAHRTSKTTAKSTGKSGKKPVAVPRRWAQQQPTADRYKEIQQALADRGYFRGDPDGTWGPESIDSLKRFQHDQSLVEDGKIGSLSLIALGLGPKRNTPEPATEKTANQ
ncbi:MAG TPA: peptidoglycan-binding domain-containing protein [Bryobacteraceae bacterium]|nr:peptidoglycan-binding domain-containing protein [Bryobacteraceae bacterium]